MTKKQLDSIFKKMGGMKVLIIGDVMIDSYLWGKVERISPEAPVPVLSVQKRQERLGGAANVALNIQALGAIPYLCSIIGNDMRGSNFLNLLKENGISQDYLIKSSRRPTTTKFRIISQNQHHLLRVDEEIDAPLEPNERKKFKDNILSAIRKVKPEVIIFQDYDKGCISPDLIKDVNSLAKSNKIPVAVDPKKRNFREYRDVTLFKPNLKELKDGLKLDGVNDTAESLEKSMMFIEKLLKPENTLITLSEKGIFYHSSENRKHISEIIPAKVRHISDVSGAGDTVISCASLCLAQHINIRDIAVISNLAGGIVCEYPGVVPVIKDRLIAESIEHYGLKAD